MTTTHSRPTTGGGTSPEHPNARLMRDFFDAFGAADRDRLAALMADDLIWHLPGSSPISGDWHGVAGLLGGVPAIAMTLFGAWQTTQALLPLLHRSPHPRIVNVSSEGGSISQMTGGTPAYSVSKAALNALTRLLAEELRSDRVLVNAVCPGWTDTYMGQGGRPVKQGAASVLWAVTLPDDGPTGGFYRDGYALPW